MSDTKEVEYSHSEAYTRYSSLDPLSQGLMALRAFQIIESQKIEIKKLQEEIDGWKKSATKHQV